jgi:alpha/beta superfamily hydrolase
LSWAAQQAATSHGKAPQLHVLAGAGHFFHGKLHELKPLVLGFLRA